MIIKKTKVVAAVTVGILVVGFLAGCSNEKTSVKNEKSSKNSSAKIAKKSEKSVSSSAEKSANSSLSSQEVSTSETSAQPTDPAPNTATESSSSSTTTTETAGAVVPGVSTINSFGLRLNSGFTFLDDYHVQIVGSDPGQFPIFITNYTPEQAPENSAYTVEIYKGGTTPNMLAIEDKQAAIIAADNGGVYHGAQNSVLNLTGVQQLFSSLVNNGGVLSAN